MKKIFKFLIILLPWFISSIVFKSDTIFYNNLNLPSFAPNPFVFVIVWTILYILIALSIFNMNEYSANYKKILLINYVSNQTFSFFFFILKSPFLALIDTVITLISALFLYYESKLDNEKSSKLLIPYLIWNLFATILIIFVFFMNI